MQFLTEKKGYPSPLLKIINGCSELGVDPKSFSDFLKKEHPDIVRQAIEQEGEIAAIMMLNLPIWNIAVGQEVANAIRNMQEPWDGIGILWSVYPYAPYEEIGIENPVFDAIVDISESIFNAIRTSSSPWVIISEIRDIEPLSKGDDARSAITDAEETIIHGIQKDPNILKYVSWALFALTSDDMIESVANALPNLENPEYYLSRIVSIGKYAKNTGILASIQKSLIEIAGKIEDTSTPSWTISYLSNTLKKVSNKVIEKALTDAIPLIAKEIRESNTPSEVMKRVSWHEEISSAEEIANAVREKIESGEDVNILISQVGNIDVLASREDIKKALVHFITNTISPCKAIHTIWGNDLWALDGNLRKAASSVVSKIADQIRSIGNPSYIIILLGRAKFLFSAKEIQDAINEQAVIYRMIDICSGLQRSSRSRELCLKNDLILIGEFLTDENCKLLKEAIQSFSKNP